MVSLESATTPAKCPDASHSDEQRASRVKTSDAAPGLPPTLSVHVRNGDDPSSLAHDLSAKANLGMGDDDPTLDFANSPDDGFDQIDVNPQLLPHEAAIIRKVLNKYREVFRPAWGLLSDGSAMDIRVKDGAKPIASQPYRLSPRARRDMDNILDEMREKGRSEPSTSPWAAPAFIVYNHEKPRLVIDFRKVNNLVERDMYPIPRQNEIFDAVNGAQYISVLDLTKGFFQIPLDPKAREKTAFVLHRGLEQLTVSVMGFLNSPAFFQRKMDEILAPYRWNSVVAYLDDLIIWSSSIEDHALHLEQVLEAFHGRNLTLSASKAHIAYFDVKALGHKVGRLGLGTLEDKVEAMRRLPVPQNLKELEVALNTFGYYRQFVPGFAQIAKPLYDAKNRITKPHNVVFKNAPVVPSPDGKRPGIRYSELQRAKFEWTDECQAAFDSLKERLCLAEVLVAPDYDRPFVLYCNASYHGYGVALHQLPKGATPKYGKSSRMAERPILYMSRSLNKHECNYAPTELEAGCIVWAVTKLAHYLDGSQMEIVTDHSALRWILGVKDAPISKGNNRLLQWSLVLAQHGDRISVVHRPGLAHGNVDGLSRLIEKIHAADPPAIPFKSIQVNSTATSCSESTDWKELYLSDPSLGTIYRTLIKKVDELRSEFHAFSVDPKDGKLWVRIADAAKLCLPVGLLKDRISSVHAKYNHLGHAKTFDRLNRNFWHPLLHKECRRICLDCASCRENSIARHLPYGQMEPIVSPAIPFDTVTMDFVTGLPHTRDGFDAFTTVTDKFTKVLRVYPCRTTDTADVVAERFYRNVYRQQGLPRVIISDRDTKFTGQFWQALCRLVGVEHRMSTSYHPQSDGQSEKSNQNVEIALRHYVDWYQEAWADWQLTGRLCLRGKGLAVGERLPRLVAGLGVERTAAGGAFPWAEELPVHVWPLCLQDWQCN